jgi:DNA gyrase subunit A
MTKDDIIERISRIARGESADHLLETSAATLHAELYEAAVDEFGGWDGALAATLRAALSEPSATRSSGRSAPDKDQEHVVREVGEAAGHPLFAITTEGAFYEVPGADVPVTAEPSIPATPHGAGRVVRLLHLGDPSGLIVFSDRGRYFGLSDDMFPRWDGDMLNRRIQDVIKLDADEQIVDALRRDDFFGGRITHVTEQAKGKASDVAEISYTLDREPREAFLLDEGDRPVSVMAGFAQTSVFCASAMGKAIHFEADELRTMGLKARGVNVMKLDGERDAVVSAFPGEGVEQVALITAQGLAKRVDFDEFRTQGRNGAGLQLLRLERGDKVAAVVPCEAAGDLAITTDRGRLHRVPATAFARMGRPAKGNRAIELIDDERVVGLSTLPCGSEEG